MPFVFIPTGLYFRAKYNRPKGSMVKSIKIKLTIYKIKHALMYKKCKHTANVLFWVLVLKVYDFFLLKNVSLSYKTERNSVSDIPGYSVQPCPNYRCALQSA